MQVMKDNISDFPGYHITREGLLYSRYNKRGQLTNRYHQNKLYNRSNGYSQVVLKIRKLNKLRRVYIHRLVAEVYIPNPENKPCVCHKNSIRTDNRVENLYWGTYKENSQQAAKEGKLSNKRVLRCLVFSDLHIHDYKKFPSRLDTSFKVLEYLVKKADLAGVPILFCGDLLHESHIISQDLLIRLLDEFTRLRDYNTTIYGISGNHTIPIISRVDIKPPSWDSYIDGISKSFYRCIDYKRIHLKNLYIYGVPYIDHNIGLNEYLKNIELVGSNRCKHILLLHTDYPGAEDTDGRKVDSVENLNLNILNRFDLVLCGHIHKPQRLSKKVYMVGAPYQQRRTDKNTKLGYWELYSDLSMKFVELKGFPKFIDVESEDEIKDDGNYYTVVPKQKTSEQASTNHKITKQLTKTKLAKRYLKEKGIKDEKKQNLLIRTLKRAEE